MSIKCKSKNCKRREHLGDLRVDSRMIIKCISEKQGVEEWTEFVHMNTIMDVRVPRQQEFRAQLGDDRFVRKPLHSGVKR
jgi:hypothetical protein